jgi:hypothetical protein
MMSSPAPAPRCSLLNMLAVQSIVYGHGHVYIVEIRRDRDRVCFLFPFFVIKLCNDLIVL